MAGAFDLERCRPKPTLGARGTRGSTPQLPQERGAVYLEECLEKLVHSTYIVREVTSMAATKQERRLREERLGFRVDEPTKALIERDAQLERRKLTDFCMTALTDAARRTIAGHETLVVSDPDRAVFFDARVNP